MRLAALACAALLALVALRSAAAAPSLPASPVDATWYVTQPMPEGDLVQELKLEVDQIKQEAIVRTRKHSSSERSCCLRGERSRSALRGKTMLSD